MKLIFPSRSRLVVTSLYSWSETFPSQFLSASSITRCVIEFNSSSLQKQRKKERRVKKRERETFAMTFRRHRQENVLFAASKNPYYMSVVLPNVHGMKLQYKE